MSQFAATLKSIAKILLQSKFHVELPGVEKRGETIIVMANGPSLKESLERNEELFLQYPSIAVNFAPISEEFFKVRPSYLVVADPGFFQLTSENGNMARLSEAMARIDWPLTVFVPAKSVRQARTLWPNESISICGFNAIGLDGYPGFRSCVYKHRLGMPRPRNVAIPALMIAIWLGYKEVLLFGADHSWMKTISVTDDNEVVSIQPHFYKDDASEEERVRHTYRGYRLHTIVESFAIAFKSYHIIEDYARRAGVRIVNMTPGSMIDAFGRKR